MPAPLISVLLPVRDGGEYLPEALASLETQTCRDFEVVAVDDGSTDGTSDRLLAWAKRDARIRVVKQDHQGVTVALNKAIEHSQGRFLARMDADDIALPHRFERQLQALADDPRVGVCGTWVKVFGVLGRHTWRYPVSDDGIRARLMFDCPLAHPSVMIRREALDGMQPVYRTEYRRAQDYDLWERLRTSCRFRNVPTPLLAYRIHPLQATVTDEAEMFASAARVRKRLLSSWWPEATEEECRFHHELSADLLAVSPEGFAAAERWLLELAERHRRRLMVAPDVWSATLAVKWLEVCRHFRGLGLRVLRQYAASPLAQIRAVPPRRVLRLVVDVLLRSHE